MLECIVSSLFLSSLPDLQIDRSARVLTGETGKEAILLTVHGRGTDNSGAGENAANELLTLGLVV